MLGQKFKELNQVELNSVDKFLNNHVQMKEIAQHQKLNPVERINMYCFEQLIEPTNFQNMIKKLLNHDGNFNKLIQKSFEKIEEEKVGLKMAQIFQEEDKKKYEEAQKLKRAEEEYRNQLAIKRIHSEDRK